MLDLKEARKKLDTLNRRLRTTWEYPALRMREWRMNQELLLLTMQRSSLIYLR